MSLTSSNMQSAVVLHGPCDLRIEERPRLAPGPGECQVEIQATGLCGSDRKWLVFIIERSFTITGLHRLVL